MAETVRLNHDTLYAGLVCGALFALASQCAEGQFAPGATAAVLGAIALQDYLSWRKFRARGGRLSRVELHAIDFVGIAAGVFAIAGAGFSNLLMCVLGCLGYILACLAFWWRLPHVDGDANRQVMRIWRAEPGARAGYIAGWVVATIMLLVFLRLVLVGIWDSNDAASWWWLSAALGVYFLLYTVIGPTLRLFKSDASDDGREGGAATESSA